MLIARKVVSGAIVNIGAGSTAIATIPNTIGANFILIRAYSSANANPLTITAKPSFTGSVDAGGTLNFLIPTGAADASSAEGTRFIILEDLGASIGLPMMTDFIRIYGSKAAGGGNTTFDIWAVYDSLPGQLPF